MSENGAMRIIYLQAENVKRLKAVRIRPDKTLVKIEGRNAQGKSSVLDAIAAALGGGKWNPDMPVRKGEKRASVKLDLGELQIERRWTAAGGTSLEVTSKGVAQSSPQSILDKLVGDLTFDPLAFVRMKPAEQTTVLKRLAGLDFDAIDREREELYGKRTVANRDLKSAEASLGTMPHSNVPAKPVDVAELAKKNADAVAANAEIDRLEHSADGYKRTADGIERQGSSHAADLSARLEEARATVARLDKQLADAKAAKDLELNAAIAKEREARSAAAAKKRIDTSGFAAELQNADTANRMIREAAAWRERAKIVDARRAEADSLTSQIEAIDDKKRRLLAGAKFPIDGLGIDAGSPTLNDVPFSQASSAEQLRVGVAIGLAEKSKARIMLCRDGSLLDAASLEDLHRIAEEFDAQIFVERVADQASASAVYIEDGEVLEHAENDE